jgi:hypothetical protein
VASIRRWWEQMGRVASPHAERLLICADAGGGNDYRRRAWKTELGRFAAETGLAVTVCHFPPGTSKWNQIEHRRFSAISTNWRGRPLVSHEVIVELIGATMTRSGVRVRAELDRAATVGRQGLHPELAAVPLRRHEWHGDCNYPALPTAAEQQRRSALSRGDRARTTPASSRPQPTDLAVGVRTLAVRHKAEVRRRSGLLACLGSQVAHG